MVNKGKRTGDFKKKKEVRAITFFHNPNDAMAMPDPVQQFDILDGVEKDKKIRPKDVFENYHNAPDRRKIKKENKKHRNQQMKENQQRGQKRGLEKKKPTTKDKLKGKR
tara:strand:+ start:845 stop:1171 length:327 start_codon:yes stop_codon:yes gene_type:complete